VRAAPVYGKSRCEPHRSTARGYDARADRPKSDRSGLLRLISGSGSIASPRKKLATISPSPLKDS